MINSMPLPRRPGPRQTDRRLAYNNITFLVKYKTANAPLYAAWRLQNSNLGLFAPALDATSEPCCASTTEQHLDQHALLVARSQETTLHLVGGKRYGLSSDFCARIDSRFNEGHTLHDTSGPPPLDMDMSCWCQTSRSTRPVGNLIS